MTAVAVFMSLFLAVGYPIVAWQCVTSLQLPKREQWIVSVFLILYLAACGLVTHGDIALHLIADEPMGRDDFGDWFHLGGMAAQTMGAAGIIGAVIIMRAAGTRLIVGRVSTTEASLLADRLAAIERLRRDGQQRDAEVDLLRATNSSLRASIANERLLKHALKGRVDAVRQMTLMLGEKLETADLVDAEVEAIMKRTREVTTTFVSSRDQNAVEKAEGGGEEA